MVQTTPYDPRPKNDSETFDAIKKAVEKPHWTMVPMFVMTFVILVLTGWMAYSQYTANVAGSNSEQVAPEQSGPKELKSMDETNAK